MRFIQGVPLTVHRLCAAPRFCPALSSRALLIVLLGLTVVGANQAFGANNVTVTLATGGLAISADTTSAAGGTGAYALLTGPVLTENAKTVIGTGSIVLNVPSGFEFSNGVNSATVKVTGDAALTIAATSGGTGVQTLTVTPTTTTITIWVIHQSSTLPATISWSGIGVRPTAGTPLANGNITETGTASIAYAGGSSAANYGVLTEVGGATDHYSVSASTSQNAGVAFAVTVTAQDKFSNTSTNDSSTVVTLSSSTGNVSFDGNVNGLYNNSSSTLTNGTFAISARDSTAETANITATDPASKTGTLSGVIVSANPPTGAFRSVGTGNWGTTTTWQTWNGSAWAAATTTPVSTTPLTTIQSPNVVTVASSVTAGNTVVNSGGTISIALNKVLTISSGPGANMDIFGTVNGAGQMSAGAGTIVVVESGGSWDLSSSGANLTIGTLSVAGGTVTTASNKGFTGGGTLYITAGTVTIGAANTGGADMSFSGAFNMSGGTFTLGHLWNTPVPSSWNMTGGTFKIQGANPAIQETNFFNLELACSSSSTATLNAGALSITGNLALNTGNKLNLGGFTSTADTLTQGGVTQASGTYTSSNDSTFLTGTGSLVVSKATPTISGVTSKTISYGTTSLTLTGTVSAGTLYPTNGATVSATINGHTVNGTVSGSTGGFSITYNDTSLATDSVSGSPYTITYAYAGDVNLNAAPNNTSTTLTVTKVTPTLTAPAAGSITYGQTLASSTLSGGAATNANNNGSVAGSFAFTTPSTAPSAGTASQSVTFTPTDSTDYNTAASSASVTVNPLAVNLTGTRNYDGTTTAAAAILSVANKVGSDNVTVGGTSATLASKNAAVETISSFSGLTLGGSASANYTLTAAGGSVTVNKTNLTVTAATNSKTYDGTTNAAATPTITSGSIQTGDAAPAWTESYNTKDVGTGKTLTPAGLVSDGNSGNNYNYTYATVTTGVITTKALTVTGLSANSKCFDGTTNATLSGSAAFLGTESAGAGTTSDGKPYSVDTVSTGGTPTGAFGDASPGTGKSVTVSGVTVSGTGSANYMATQPTGLTANIFALPTAHNATGGGAYCTGGSGVTVGLDNSETGINYQLLRNGSPVGSPVAGTGSALNFGAQTVAGTYTLLASNTTTTCTAGMSGSATVVASLTDPLKWVSGSGAWQFSTTAGIWQDGAANPATYCDGFDVLLDDSATVSSPALTLNTTVAPLSVTNNSTKNYSISGSGSVSGSGGLTKLGTSTLTLSGNNSYSGLTAVNGGILALSGSISNSTLITVGASATLNATGRSDGTLPLGIGQGLKGSGTVVGVLAVGSGATLFPGTGINSLTNTGATSLQGGGTNIVKVIDAGNSAGVGYDSLTVSGNIGIKATSGNPFNIKLTSVNGSGAAGSVTNFNNNTNYTWTVASGTVTNFDATLFNLDTSSFSNDLAGGQFLLQSGSLKIVFTNNHPPVAAPTNYTRTAGQNMKIVIASVMTNLTSDPDGQAVLLQRFESISGPMRTARGYYISTNSTYLFYTNKTDNNLDSINYVITDNAPYRNGDTRRFTTNSIIISTTTSGTSTNNLTITASGSGTNTLSFWGVPGLTYVAQYSTNLGPSVLWFDLVTTNAPSNGVWTVIDNNATNASRFYRSKWQY